MSERYAELIDAIAGQPLPQALIDLDAFDANLAAVAQRAAGKPIRLASKSLRVPALLRRALDYGPAYRGILAFSLIEAVGLWRQGFDDIVVAYPSCQPAALAQLAQAVATGANIVAMADCSSHLGALQAAAEAANTRLPIAFDLDMSMDLPGLRFGVYRSPLDSADKVMALHGELARYQRLQLVGVMGYEAQIAGLGDAVPGKGLENLAVRALKQWAIPRIAARRQAMVDALRSAGAELRFVNGGGSGSIESTGQDRSVSEFGLGSALYTPTLFDQYRAFRHLPAAFFALEACRRSDASHLTCQGGGYIGSGASSRHKLPTPVWPAGLQLEGNEGAGEVQTPVTGAAPYPIGHAILFRPAKAGEFLDRFAEVACIAGQRAVERMPTYRGLGWCLF
ncbi:alanine racemase [Chitinimonas sp.]|uniref:alanine racemase n=1 Tax=Chitinimonas sp. TaxID=1934313 RepID=UPI0035B0AC9B